MAYPISFVSILERSPDQTHLIQSAAVGYRFSCRPLPFSAYFLFSHSCMSLFCQRFWRVFSVLPYSVVSMATLSTALTIALCFAFAFSATVFLLLGE
jgi:hypothetical protein